MSESTNYNRINTVISVKLWWLVMLPGLVMVAFAIGVIVWPYLLAYVVATILLLLGTMMIVLGWQMRQLQHKSHSPNSQQSPNPHSIEYIRRG